MSLFPLATRLLPVVVFLSSAIFSARAQDARDRTDMPRQPATGTARTATRPPARGPLPDPVLLDGSTQAPDKKSEYGMLGDFELPGDENVRNGKVGGQQGPPPGAAGGGQQVAAMPQGGGGGPQGQPQSGAQPAQGGGAQAPNPNAKQGSGAPMAGGDPNAKAEGTQVGQLQTDPAGQGQVYGEVGNKPQQVAIGDSAMQIQTVPNAPSIVGASTPAGSTQQAQQKTGATGSKGGGGTSSGQNVERGRVMPSGL